MEYPLEARPLENQPGVVWAWVDDLWTVVRRWAADHGHAYHDSYGVVDVAPT